MKKEFLIKSLNLNAAEALTLEKGEDRMEFQALLLPNFAAANSCSGNEYWEVCPKHVSCPSDCPPVPDPTPVPSKLV